jgi:hypothetical protein
MISISTFIPRAVKGVFCLTVLFVLLSPAIQAATSEQAVPAGPERFEDRGDGTVLDRQTGLLWLKSGKSTLGAMAWKEAGSFCKGLQFAGYTDWRLPTKEELASIVDPSNQSPALPIKSPFENVVTFLDYWTQTDHTSGPGYAWAVNLYYGNKKFLNKKKYAFAWPVRRMAGAAPGGEKPVWPATEPLPWASLKTRYTVIHYQGPDGLQALRRALYPLAIAPDTEAALLGKRVDALFREVQTLLDMRKAVDRVAITVYRDQQQLAQALTQAGGQPRRAWYSHKQNTIFVSRDRLSEDILAHEMALAVIYQYMQVPPPRTTAKILAGYVDSQRKSRRGQARTPRAAKTQ